jgi:hypothetical protein
MVESALVGTATVMLTNRATQAALESNPRVTNDPPTNSTLDTK